MCCVKYCWKVQTASMKWIFCLIQNSRLIYGWWIYYVNGTGNQVCPQSSSKQHWREQYYEKIWLESITQRCWTYLCIWGRKQWYIPSENKSILRSSKKLVFLGPRMDRMFRYGTWKKRNRLYLIWKKTLSRTSLVNKHNYSKRNPNLNTCPSVTINLASAWSHK